MGGLLVNNNKTLSMTRFHSILALVSLYFFSPITFASGLLGGSLSVDTFSGEYGGRTAKESLSGHSINVGVNYLDKTSLTIGVSEVETLFPDVIGESGELADKTLFLDNTVARLSHVFYSDRFSGRLQPFVIRMTSEGTLSDPELGDVSVTGLGMGYETFSRDRSAHLFYSVSDYQNTTQVSQMSFTLGQSVSARLWFQARFNSVNSSALVGRRGGYRTVDGLVKYWFKPRFSFLPKSVAVVNAFGTSRFIVDPDAATVMNLSEERTGQFKLLLDWSFKYRIDATLMFGQTKFRTRETRDDSHSKMLYFSLAKRW